VDLVVAGESMRAVTRDISVGGFGAMLDRMLPAEERVTYSLRIQGPSPLNGEARIIDMKSIGGRIRGSFGFVDLSGADRERLELFVFDAILASLAK
jgi:c-di-GMP-binding flagellar brake protein YcgR